MPCVIATLKGGKPAASVRALPVLHGWSKVRGDKTGLFRAPDFPVGETGSLGHVEDHLRRWLLYHPHWLPYDEQHLLQTAVTGGEIRMPEEFPIVLWFFYLSSIVRYRPEFFVGLQDSRFWPVVLAARKHALITFLEVFLSEFSGKLVAFRQV